MFIRYRRIKSSGRKPMGVKVGRLGRRWYIADPGQSIVVEPYRLQVSIVHNIRVDGKVREQIIAELGSINSWLLPAVPCPPLGGRFALFYCEHREGCVPFGELVAAQA